MVWDQRPCIEAGSSLLQNRFQAINEIVTILVVIVDIAPPDSASNDKDIRDILDFMFYLRLELR